jgi:propionate CoA-transferase
VLPVLRSSVRLEREVLVRIDFAPVIKHPPRLRRARIFQEKPIGLRRDLLLPSLKARLLYDAQQNLFFVNLESLTLRARVMLDDIRNLAKQLIDLLCKKVFAIVSYDKFSFEAGLLDDYKKMVKYLTDH